MKHLLTLVCTLVCAIALHANEQQNLGDYQLVWNDDFTDGELENGRIIR